MKYLKHYWVCINDNNYCCLENPVEKRHPEAEYPGLDVKIWMHDEDGIDVCLSVVPDTTEVSDIIDPESNKKSVQVLTEEEFNSVAIPYFESQELYSLSTEVPGEQDEELMAQSQAKYQEAVEALHLL